MSSLMNRYFYGKAGQGDYTVEQMPTNRKQLFFTTLKVRFSSMIGLNFLQFLFMLPALLWLFVAMASALDFVADDLTLNYAHAVEIARDDIVTGAYDDYLKAKAEYDAVFDAEAQITRLEYEIEQLKATIESVESGVEINKPGNDVDKYTANDLPALRTEMDEKKIELAKAQRNLEILNDKEGEENLAYKKQLSETYAQTIQVCETYTRQLLNSNIMTSLIILAPLIALAGIGRTGQSLVLRNWARDEHSFMMDDFKEAIKKNWKQGLATGIVNGLSFPIFFIAYSTYGSMSQGSWFYVIPQAIMVIVLLLWWMANEVIFFMMVTYKMKWKDLVKNAILMTVARLPIAFLILLGSALVPAAIMLLIPMPVNMLIFLIVYGVIGFSFTLFIHASFANSCFDKYLNPRIEGAVVGRGLYKPEEEEDNPASEVTEKEDRYWEHKTK